MFTIFTIMQLRSACFLGGFLLIFISLFSTSCRKQKMLTSGGTLSFSTDTLKFDTVFTAAGSFTTGLLIYNKQSETITVSSVKLAHGATSYFHINVDGFKGNTVTDLKIAPHDSIYVFATVNIDPNNKLTPFIISDSLVATLNGKDFFVPFTAYGQNARYIVDSALSGNITWDTVLPYVIVKSAQVNPTATLNINPGCRIYMHQNSSLIVLGKLFCNGTKDDSVIFQGDRLDRSYFGYQGYAGEWGCLYFDSKSNGSRLSYTRLLNCGNASAGYATAIWLAPDSVNFNNPSATPQLTMDHCIIQNAIGYGILSFTGSLVASNCLVNSTGAQALAIFRGGFDSITNCTFANYGNYTVSHSTSPTLSVLSWLEVKQDVYEYADMNVVLRNCIVWGSLDSEIVCDTTGSVAHGNYKSYLKFDHSIIKMGTDVEGFVQRNQCLQQDPLFKDGLKGNFHLTAGSPAIGKGAAVSLTDDLEGWGATRNDIGCYQYH